MDKDKNVESGKKVEETKTETKEVNIQQEIAEIERKCVAELQRVLTKHNCVVVGIPYINADGKILANVEVRYKQR